MYNTTTPLRHAPSLVPAAEEEHLLSGIHPDLVALVAPHTPLDVPDVPAPIAVPLSVTSYMLAHWLYMVVHIPVPAGMGPALCGRTLALALAALIHAALNACVLPELSWHIGSAVALFHATAFPSCMDNRVSVRGLTPTRQRVIHRCCMDAMLKSDVVTG